MVRLLAPGDMQYVCMSGGFGYEYICIVEYKLPLRTLFVSWGEAKRYVFIAIYSHVLLTAVQRSKEKNMNGTSWNSAFDLGGK